MTALPRRGQPLIALAGLLALWIGARAWGPVASLLEVPLPLPPTVSGRVEPEIAAPESFAEPARVAPMSSPAKAPGIVAETRHGPAAPPWIAWVAPAIPATPKQTAPASRAEPPLPAPQREPPPPPSAAPLPFGAVPAEVRASRRWSADGWALWRDEARGGAALVGGGTYGASQAGAVLRYRLRPDSRFDPRAYLRVTATLSGEDEQEAAAGIAVRPLRGLPIDLMAEIRVLRFNGDRRLRPSETRVRPAAMAVIGPPPMPLPFDARAEAYAQLGYVAGEGASAFADGQARFVRDLPALAETRFRLDAGLGAWGGAQKDVERLDIGPTIAVRFPVNDEVYARASFDWRQRVAGDAEPGSGPVFTLSAGF